MHLLHTPRTLKIALDLPHVVSPTAVFDYAVPDGMALPAIGARVVVLFGAKPHVGIVTALDAPLDVALERVKPIAAVLSGCAPLPADWLALTSFCAGYYQHPLGAVMLNALPAQLKNPTRDVDARLTQRFALLPDVKAPPARATGRYAVWAALNAGIRWGWELAALSPKALAYLAEYAEIAREALATAPKAAPSLALGPSPALTPDQTSAVESVCAQLDRFAAHLLFGITGSGKTEVYLHLIAQIVAQGRQALVMVPEINLTPRLLATFTARFPDLHIATLHSELAESERLHNWLMAASGAAQIIIGTRLAILTPLPKLGLIVVDEEHDPSFKQMEGMRYSARDVAVWRAKDRAIPIVLGSATPSLETWANAHEPIAVDSLKTPASKGSSGNARYAKLMLRSRAVAGAGLPTVKLISLDQHKLRDGLAEPVWDALAERLARREQSLVFLNRRGYAPVLSCAACHWVSECHRCTAFLVWHKSDHALRCHHCGFEAKVPRSCPTCGNVDLHAFGQGTQRLEAHLAEALPTARVLRIDRDSTRHKGSAEALFGQAYAGEIDILVGTQMLAKGHDFKLLTLVAVANADAAWFSADFRASERLFAQLMQVAGRAGRDSLPGEVLIQTKHPDHALYRALQQHDFPGFAKALMRERRAASLPPFAYQAILRAEAETLDGALAYLQHAREAATALNSGVMLYDPVPMTLTKLMNKHRAQLLLESTSRVTLQAFLSAWLPQLHALKLKKGRWYVEVDPLGI